IRQLDVANPMLLVLDVPGMVLVLGEGGGLDTGSQLDEPRVQVRAKRDVLGLDRQAHHMLLLQSLKLLQDLTLGLTLHSRPDAAPMGVVAERNASLPESVLTLIDGAFTAPSPPALALGLLHCRFCLHYHECPSL